MLKEGDSVEEYDFPTVIGPDEADDEADDGADETPGAPSVAREFPTPLWVTRMRGDAARWYRDFTRVLPASLLADFAPIIGHVLYLTQGSASATEAGLAVGRAHHADALDAIGE